MALEALESGGNGSWVSGDWRARLAAIIVLFFLARSDADAELPFARLRFARRSTISILQCQQPR